MDFRELLAMAQKNNKDAQVQLKSGNLGPVTEFNSPGAREAKAKLDMSRITARVHDAKQKQQSLQKPQQHQQKPGQKPSAAIRPVDTSKKKPVAISSQPAPKLNNRPAENGTNASTKPSSSKPLPPVRSSTSQLLNKPTPSVNGNPHRRPDGSSSLQANKSSSSKPPQTNGHSLSNSKSNTVPAPTKKRLNTAPPVPSYHDLINAAQTQHKEHIQEPEKFFRTPVVPPPLRRVESVGSLKATPSRGGGPGVGSSASTSRAGIGQAQRRHEPRSIPNASVPPLSDTRRNSTSSTSSLKPPAPTAKIPGSYPKRPLDGPVSSKVAPAGVKSYAHVGNGNKNTQNGQRGGMPSRGKPAPPISNGRTVSSNPSSSRIAPVNSRVSLPNKAVPADGRNALSNARPAERGQAGTSNVRLPIRPPVTSGRPPIPPARQSGMPPPARIPPAKIAPARRLEPPPPPPPPAPRRNIVYPNGPSFPAFRPGYKAPKRRIEEDEEEDDDEMADFIDDEDLEDDVDVSKHLREIFPRYDSRRFVGRDDDDDDLAHMETRVEDQWREEERSAKIGELEDELEDELEQLQAKVERVKAIKNKKARKF